MKVYIVGDHGPEHNSISSIHKTYKGALKSWDKLRLELLEDAKSSISKSKDMNDIYKRFHLQTFSAPLFIIPTPAKKYARKRQFDAIIH